MNTWMEVGFTALLACLLYTSVRADRTVDRISGWAYTEKQKTRTLWSGVKEVMRFVGLFICGHVVYCGIASGLSVWEAE